jgi:hypothetical protein
MSTRQREGRQLRLAARVCALLAAAVLFGLPAAYFVFSRFVSWGSTGEIGAIMGWLILGVPLGVTLGFMSFVLSRAAGQRLG